MFKKYDEDDFVIEKSPGYLLDLVGWVMISFCLLILCVTMLLLLIFMIVQA